MNKIISAMSTTAAIVPVEHRCVRIMELFDGLLESRGWGSPRATGHSGHFSG